MPNPFDLRGPEFLIFYITFAIAVNLLLRRILRSMEQQGIPGRWSSDDPYKIAYLRSGASEAITVAIFSLVDRGLLKSVDTRIVAEPKAQGMVKRPIEQAVVNFFKKPHDVNDIFKDTSIDRINDDYLRQLTAEGLFADKEVVRSRSALITICLGLIIGVSVYKINIAISRGRYNIEFLILLTIIFAIWTASAWSKLRTGAGDAVMERQEKKYQSLKARASSLRPGGMTNETAYLAAVFGLAALPEGYFPFVKSLFPKAVDTAGGSYSYGGCGSAGSSGCGGGGCGGGGCGGCGGG